MREQFLALVESWINQYKTDIKGKVEKFLNENDSCPEELADVIDVNVDEIYKILDGEGEDISVETFGKLLLASGFALAIEPIEQTPLGSYDNVNPHVMREPQREERRAPQPNPFARPIGGAMPMGGGMPHRNPFGMPMPPHGFDPQNIPPHIREKIERELGIGDEEPYARPQRPVRQAPRHEEEEEPKSPFALMGRDELTKIIVKHLWDTEIDVENAPRTALVRFLEEKDKRVREAKRREQEIDTLENDPKVSDFISKMKSTCKNNPQFRSYMKNFLGQLDSEE